jgi:nitrogen regulatory protein PII
MREEKRGDALSQGDSPENEAETLDLVTIIVQHKVEGKVIDAVLKAGAPGVTFHMGRGTGIRQHLGYTGNLIEQEKSIIMTAVPSSISPSVIKAAKEAAGLDRPENGLIFVGKVQKA